MQRMTADLFLIRGHPLHPRHPRSYFGNDSQTGFLYSR
jgi:hypothetical protein